MSESATMLTQITNDSIAIETVNRRVDSSGSGRTKFFFAVVFVCAYNMLCICVVLWIFIAHWSRVKQ